MYSPYWRRPKPQPRPAPPPPALPEGLLDEFREMPLGGFAGEATIVRPAEPPPPPDRGLVIEPPPWAGQPAVDLPPPSEPVDPATMAAGALSEMKQLNGDEEQPRFTPGPPAFTVPLQHVPIPEPDWREPEP
jgi:hypothetical protein